MSLGDCEVLLLQFGEESHVLDGDDRLVGEGPEELYLLVREWCGGFPTHRDRSDGMSFPEHGHGEGASVVGHAREALKLVLRVLAYVGGVDDAAGPDGAMGGRTPAWRRRVP